jgi:7,8-dihydropterin-6-yl-methyl-4-(beta-D-ribofuranosyl)aminobenzene 5'-phosphate synthase
MSTNSTTNPPAIVTLDPVDAVSITTLIDNAVDVFLPNTGPAKRPQISAKRRHIEAAFLEGGNVGEPLRAEHGFSALITVARNGREHTLLFDAGTTPDGAAENMRRLSIPAKDIEAIIFSHGHFDHTAGLDGVMRLLGRTNLPVIIHPDFWNRRRVVFPGREPIEIPSTSRSALLGAGFEIVEEKQPSFLLDGSVLITGEVDRTTSFEPGFPPQEKFHDGQWVPDPLVLDDQAMVIHVRDRGLVVLTGCGHAGIVNIVRYARKLTGVEKVHAVIGGFHLGGPLFEPIIPHVCEALAGLAPDVIVPTHCTGWRAVHRLAAAFPDAFIQNSVGTRYDLTASAADETSPVLT